MDASSCVSKMALDSKRSRGRPWMLSRHATCSGFGCLTFRKQTHLPGGLVHRVGLERLDPGALPNTLVFLFYAGTGAYIEGVNCIAPFGTDISTLAAAQRSTIALPAIQDALRRNAAASVMVLDTGFPEVLRARAPSR